MGKKEVRSQGFSSGEMLQVDNYIFNLWNAVRESEDLRHKEYIEEFLITIIRAVKFRSHSTNRQKLEAKVGRAILDYIHELEEKKGEVAEGEVEGEEGQEKLS